MDIILKNVHKYDSNFYRGIEIHEISEEHRYLVKFFGRDVWFDSSMVGVKLSDSLTNLSPEEQIREIIKNYLNSVRINLFSGVWYSISRYQNMCFRAEGTRYLFVNIHNLGLRNIIDDVHSKYVQDRYDYCYKNNGIKSYKITTADFSSYQIIHDKLCFENDKKENILEFALKTDLDSLVLESEQEFIRQFIIDRVSKFGEEIECFEIYDLQYKIKGYLLKCGDVRIFFNNYKSLQWIFDIVNKYNRELRECNKNINKRQLKMEGF